MRCSKIVLVFMFFSLSIFSQENQIESDTVSSEKEKKLEFNLDIVSRYLWRGQCWGGNYVAVQPTI